MSLNRLEKLEEVVSDLEHENRLLKDEVIMAEKAVERAVTQLENNQRGLKEVQRFFKQVKQGPRDTVSNLILSNEHAEKIISDILTHWVSARKMREENSNGDK